MLARFGHQRWWPGETPFEICVGAILTQNTNWPNVERAIANLKTAGVLTPEALYALPEARLAGLIRPAGYFNVKARRLRCFLHVLVEKFDGQLEKLFTGKTAAVRERLLSVNGIGPETADCLLLYVGGHASFVIDAYTKRIFERHGWMGSEGGAIPSGGQKGNIEYSSLQSLCESALTEKSGPARLDYWQDYHAQIVMVGKQFCRPREPLCEGCPLKPLLPRSHEQRAA
jgi:endonuclease-3 related protein